MQKSRLLELFKSLNKTEVKKLRKWVRSPFFNQREDVVLLFDYLDKNRPFEKIERLHREYIFSKIFPNEKYDEKKIGYAQSFLLTEIKKFIAYEEFSKDEIRPQIHLVQNLRKRGLNRHFESEWKNANVLLEKQSIRNSDYHFFNYQLQNEQHEYSNSLSRKEPKGLQEASNELTNYFIAQKLKLSCDQLNAQNFIQVEYEQDFLSEVITFLEEKKELNLPSVEVYYHYYKTLIDQDNSFFYQKLKESLVAYQGKFPKSELNYLYLATINYCIKQHNAGKKNFTREMLQLYKEGLKNEVFLVNGILDRFTYKNTIAAAIHLKEFEWVEKFIHDYKNQLDVKWREDMFNYNLAVLYCNLPDYDKAMTLLQHAEFDDIFLKIATRKMLLKIYFDLEELNALESLLDSFQRFLTRHSKNLSYHQPVYINFIKFVRRLLQTPKFDKPARQNLKIEIESTKDLADKKWLIEKLNIS